MRVRVVAPFALAGQAADGSVEVPEGAQVSDLLGLAVRPPLYSRLLPFTVNGEPAGRSRRLRADDRVVFIMLLPGG